MLHPITILNSTILNSNVLNSLLQVIASRRPTKGACRVRGDRGMFVRVGRRLAVTLDEGKTIVNCADQL
jgi:hypothetical protein